MSGPLSVYRANSDNTSADQVPQTVRDSIEAAVEAQDISSIIQFLFSGQNEKWPLDQLDINKQLVLKTLEELSVERTRAIEDLCRANAQEIAHAVEDALVNTKILKSMRAKVEKASGSFLEAGQKLQDSVQGIKQQFEEQIMQQEFKRRGERLLRQLTRLSQALDLYKEGQYLKVLSILEIIEEQQQQLGKEGLQFVSDVISYIKQQIEQEGKAQLKDWLAIARTGSVEVGQRVIRQAVNARGEEEEQTARRNKFIQMLQQGMRPETIAKKLPNPFHMSDENLGKIPGGEKRLFQSPFLRGVVNLGQIQLAFNILDRLGKFDEGKTYYEESRKQQLVADLVPPQDFLAQHQQFLLQIVGFFVIEREVNRSEIGLSTKSALWSTSVSGLRRSLDEALERVNSASAMLLINDFIRLCCRAWETCAECNTQNISAVLLDGLSRYEILSNESFVQDFKSALKSDPLRRIEVKDNRTKQSQVASLELPPSIDFQVSNVNIPFLAPFSQLLPKTVRLLKQNQGDIASYLEGLATSSEILSAIKQGNISLVRNQIVPMIQSHIGDLLKQNIGFSLLMVMTANISCLRFATKFLEKRALETCGEENRSGGNVFADLDEELQKLEQWCEDQVLAAIVKRIEKLLENMFFLNWTPDVPQAKTISQPIEQTTTFLLELQEQLQLTLRPGSDKRLLQCSIKAAANWLLWFLSEQKIQKFNLFAIQRLQKDVLALQQTEKSMKIDGQVEAPLQLTNLLLSSAPQEALDENIWTEKYPHLNPMQMGSIMEKVVDVGGQAQTLNRGGCRSFTSKKDFLHIAFQLKEKFLSQ